MAQIHVLDPHTADKIAAGEVIERPVSVAKELLENAIDAGATEIVFQFEQGGIRKIAVTDNGSGMSKEDLPLAFQRHATSKISDFNDLFALQSFGFRGEALASIAVVSQIKALSGQSKDEPAWLFEKNPNTAYQLTQTSPEKGTTIEVNNLFFNVPARRKFLKTPNQEFHLAFDMLARYTLIYPHIDFKIINDKKVVFHTAGYNDVESRMALFYGSEMNGHIIHLKRLEISTNTFVEAWLADATFTRNNRNQLTLFVNQRLVKNKELSSIVEQAYEGYIPKGRFPVALLHLTVPTETIDVNVHPAKTKVKLTQLNRFRDTLLDALRDAIWQSKVAVQLDVQHEADEAIFVEEPTVDTYEQSSVLFDRATLSKKMNKYSEGREQTFDFSERLSQPVKDTSFSFHRADDCDSSHIYTASNNKCDTHEKVPASPLSVLDDGRGFLHYDFSEDLSQNINIHDIQDLSIIGQLNNTFILAQNKHALYIIDQHTCHERLLYDKYKRLEEEKHIDIQMLAVPVSITLTPAQESSFTAHIFKLRDLGIIMAHLDGRHYELKGLPVILYEINNHQEFILDLIDSLENQPHLTMGDIRDKVVTTASCKGAVKANWPLSQDEMKKLLKDLSQLKNPHTCPHGRPIITKITMNDLYHLFKRGSYPEKDH